MRLLSIVAAVFAGSGVLLAHGGQYRGHWSSPPIPPPPPAPAAPGPGGPVPAGAPASTGPLSGGRPTITDGTSWQVWWEFHKDVLLDPLGAPLHETVSGSDEYYLGAMRHIVGRDRQLPTAKDREEVIAPALLAALRSSDDRDLVTACLVALAKLGFAPKGAGLPGLFAARLHDANQEVRETAVLAFGIAGTPLASATLAQLVADRKESDRTRTFAAYSLALLGRRATDVRRKEAVRSVLLERLQDRTDDSRDLRVALVQGLGLLAPDPARGAAEKRLLWQLTADLWSFYARDLGRGNQLVQAHAPIAVSRLLGRGATADHQRAKAILVAELSSRERRNNTIYQSAAMALGTICLPPEDSDDGFCSAALLRYYQQGTDQLARFFSTLALGRIGGSQNRATLLDLYDHSNKATERPWIALALGLLARGQRTGDEVDREIADLLLQDLEAIENDDARSALALALGLCGHRDAAPAMLRILRERSGDDMVAGYLPVALALLDYRPAADELAGLMRRSLRRPFVLLQCASALGRLGDERATTDLLELLRTHDSLAGLASVAIALGTIRDRRSIPQLVQALADESRPALARAFAAAALGGIGDKDERPWNVPIAADCNYMATVDTLTNGATGVLDIL